jgi:BirA family biotin operon repressor/biotin-[acetyl-CoA-carboxylase] ligase
MESRHRHHETVDSTNEAAKAWARDGSNPAPHNAVVTADAQTHGRGRHGREWVSPAGKGVYLSMVWRPKIEAHQVGRLTIVSALGAARALESIAAKSIETKWPNDLLLNRKKIGGLLCEAELKNEGVEFVVAGIGLNANFEKGDFPERPIFPATSLLLETGKSWPVEELRETCIASLRQEYSRYDAGHWPTQRAEFIARCAIIGEPVSISSGTLEYSGVAVGVDEDGILLVQTANETRRVVSGDVKF